MLATRMPGILPSMTEEEALETAAVQSLTGPASTRRAFGQRPFRSPHHTASAVALVGGSTPPRPGEISLAHHGVLFLDELPEFTRHVLEVLREPLESGRITISRAAHQADFPARFQLVAAMNPCPCGYLGHPSGKCRCTPDIVARYRARISGPLLDRIDLRVEVPSVGADELARTNPGEPSNIVRERVQCARERQLARQGKSNARLEGHEVEARVRPDAKARRLLREASAAMALSARAHHRVLRVARSLADLEGCETVGEAAIAEALRYRELQLPAS
jgi:magnesium chelatase family protein